MDPRQLSVLQLFQADTSGLCRAHRRACRLVRHPERNTPAHQPFRDIRGQAVAERCQFGHPVDVEGQRRDQTRHRGEQQFELSTESNTGSLSS